MKLFLTFIAAAVYMTFPAFAGSTDIDVGSQSGAASQSGVYIEGSKMAPGLGGIGGNSTAECIINQGFQASVVGTGAGFQAGRVGGECNTRVEAKTLNGLLNAPKSAGRQAAILHFCANDASMRKTLQAVGFCADMGGRVVGARASVGRDNPSVDNAPYRSCVMKGGKLVFARASGASKQEAASGCLASWRAGLISN